MLWIGSIRDAETQIKLNVVPPAEPLARQLALRGLVPLGSLIPSISLPEFDGIRVAVDSARGACPSGSNNCVGTASPDGTYQQLALYASPSRRRS